MQSPLGKNQTAQREEPKPWPGHTLFEGRSSVRQEATLIGPVERQIEFGKTRRREFDGLSALQDRLDQVGTQKGEVDEAPDIATGDAVALGQFSQRSRASGGKLFEPRAPAGNRLDQRGSHRERSFCVATSGSTSLISTPRRLKATGAVSSIGLSPGFSDTGGMTGVQ